LKKQNVIEPPEISGQDDFTKPATYKVAGRIFIVEPFFKSAEETDETMGSILLKLMMDSKNNLQL